MEPIRNNLKRLLKGGFFHILGSSVINKCIAFVTNVLLARVLSKPEYGVFTGAFNAFYIIFVFSGLGIISGLLYFCSKNIEREEKAAYYAYGFRFGIASEILLCAALILYALYGKLGIEETRQYILSLSLLPFVAFVYDYYAIILRAEKSNVNYAKLLNLNSLFYAVFGVAGAYFGGIGGTIAGRYAAYGLAVVIGKSYCKPFLRSKSSTLSTLKKRDITAYSLKAGMTSALNVIMYRLDVTIIAIIVADASLLASYKIGAALPENFDFIPQCAMVYYLPLFIQNLNNKEWIKTKTKNIYLSIGALGVLISVTLIVLAPKILLLWGRDYLDAVPCMRVLSVSFLVNSTFRITSTNLLLAFKRAGYAVFVSMITGLSNIILDVFLTIRFGSIGAAYATLLVIILSSLLSFPYVLYIIYSDKVSYE